MGVLCFDLLHSWRHVVFDSFVGKFKVHKCHDALVLFVVVFLDHPIETPFERSDSEQLLEFEVQVIAIEERPPVEVLVAAVT